MVNEFVIWTIFWLNRFKWSDLLPFISNINIVISYTC